jgi:hypothetical protein
LNSEIQRLNPPDTNAEFFRIPPGSFLVFAIRRTHTGQTRSFACPRPADFKVAHYFFAALILAQRALCAAAILFLPAADIVRLGFGA